MKKFLLSSVALAAVAGAASAADLPSRRVAPAPAYVAVPVFTWTGFYIGANAGYASADNRATLGGTDPITNAAVATFLPNNGTKLNPEGFTGGGQIGYNYQIGSFVLGLEADASYTDLAQTRSRFDTTGERISHRTTLDYLGTVRGRIGYAFDRWLVYGTGGFAYGDVYNRTFIFADPITTVPGAIGARNRMETGYAVGGGVEYAIPNFTLFNSAATIKVEYLHYDLGDRTQVVNVLGTGVNYQTRFKNEGDLVRAGLNFKFGTY